jgi:hypothetical protein
MVDRSNEFVQKGNEMFDPEKLAELRVEIGHAMKPTPEKAEIIAWCESRMKYLKRTIAFCGIQVPMSKGVLTEVATTPDHMEYLLTKGFLPIRDNR